MNRRDFLKTTVYAGAVAMGARTASAQASPAERVRVAVMGTGGRGASLMKTAAELPNVEIATVCDVDARAMDRAAETVSKKTGKTPKKEKDLRRILEDKEIDGVICATPDHWHAPAALMTMRAGKAIYVEKPCSHNPREGEMLVEASVRHNAVFQMGNQRRASMIYQQVIREIQGGLIGEPRFARCWYTTQRGPIGKGKAVPVPEWLDWDLWQGPAPRRPFRDNIVPYTWHWFFHWGTGESGNNATHFVDVARWTLGGRFPTRVTSAGGRLFYEGDDWEWYDTQTATFEYPNRTFITWEGLSAVKARPYAGIGTGCMVYGLKGAVLFAPNNTCRHFDPAGKVVKNWDAQSLAGDAMDRANPIGGLDAAHLGNWADCIRARDRAKAYSPADEAHASTLMTHLANIAQRTGETIRTDPATGRLAQGSPGAELWAREYEKGWEASV